MFVFTLRVLSRCTCSILGLSTSSPSRAHVSLCSRIACSFRFYEGFFALRLHPLQLYDNVQAKLTYASQQLEDDRQAMERCAVSLPSPVCMPRSSIIPRVPWCCSGGLRSRDSAPVLAASSVEES